MTNQIICIPIPSGEQDPSHVHADGFVHPRSTFCPFAIMRLPQQPSGCCHFGADALVSVLKRSNAELADRLTHSMVPGEARRFAGALAKALGEYLDRDDRSVAGVELLVQGMLWFLVVSSLGFSVRVASDEE